MCLIYSLYDTMKNLLICTEIMEETANYSNKNKEIKECRIMINTC